MSNGSESGRCRREEGHFSDLREVEDPDQDDIVDERAGVDYQLLGRNVRGSAWDFEDRCCLCQARTGRVATERFFWVVLLG